MAVERRLWERVCDGQFRAIEELRLLANNLVLYDHILSLGPDDVWVSLAELYEHRIIDAIRLHVGIPAD